MKKLFISISLVISCFFFFNTSNVDAATNFTLDYDINEHFNYFYELKNNTSFYQFLVSQGSSLIDDYFKSYLPNLNHVYILYPSDLPKKISVPSGTKYVVVLSDISEPTLKYYEASFHFNLEFSSISRYATNYYLFYDFNAKLLDTSFDTYTGSSNILPFATDDVTYLLSFLYYGSLSYDSDTRYSKTDVRLTRINLNSTKYNIVDLQTRNNFLNFWANLSNIIFNNSNMQNLEDLGLSYFLTNYYIKSNRSALGLYEILNFSNSGPSISVPSTFLSQSFDNDNRYYLIPNSLSCSSSDSLLYFSVSDINTVNFISYSFLEDKLSLSNISAFSFKLKKANRIEALSLSHYIDKITDYLFLIYSSDNFSSNVFYYNPSCFSVYSAVGNVDIEFTNVNTGSTIKLTPGEQQLIIDKSDDLKKDIEKSESSSDVDISAIIGSAWSGAKTFISSSYYIMSMTTTLFGLLPPSVGSLILCVFSLGMVIILWKVFRS